MKRNRVYRVPLFALIFMIFSKQLLFVLFFLNNWEAVFRNFCRTRGTEWVGGGLKPPHSPPSLTESLIWRGGKAVEKQENQSDAYQIK